MPIDNFNIVLLGENFPVSSIDIADFRYLGRTLRQSLRVPVALQAETEGFRLQVLPDRFEATVTHVTDVDSQSQALMGLADTFLDYVGRRTVNAVGHNCQKRVAGTADFRKQLYASLVNVERVNAYLGSSTDVTAELSFFFKRGQEDRGRVLINFNQPDEILLDFNFHFDVQMRDGQPPGSAIRQLPTSLRLGAELADSLGELGARGVST